ncbi:tetratricopeptide repeat protein, partial [bacterium]|nr:tetratricopeptide repeat protein [bacterium]MBU1025269.1 tetratricopeptide repeat protein [bacterium]
MQILEQTTNSENLAGLKIKDRYVLLEEIGQGLMARAFLAYDSLLEGEVVVKILNTEIQGTPLPLGPDWTDEAKQAMKVRTCPYIATVTDFGEETHIINDDEQLIPFIVWEKVYGRTLEEFLSKGEKIDGRMIINAINQLLQVLIVLKRNNLIHGDLHIKNVMYDDVSTSRHFLKVIDFGLANIISSESDFKRDRKGVGKILSHLVSEYLQQNQEEENGPFAVEIKKLIDEISAPEPSSLDELNEFLSKTEELERKFFLGVEWFQSRHKSFPIGRESRKYLKSFIGKGSFPLVGIEEIDELYSWLRKGLDEGLGRILAINADTGLGKSRWSLELLFRIAEADSEISIMRSQAYPGDINRPLESIRRLWRSYLGENQTDNYKTFITNMFPEIPLLVEPLVDLLLPRTNNFSEPIQAMDDVNYQKLITTGLKHLALKNQLVICIDDVNNSDLQSLKLLHELSTATTKYPIILILTYANESEGEFHNLISDLSRRDNYLVYNIKELTLSQTQELIQARYSLKDKETTFKVAGMIHPHVGGNPFYLHEMLSFMEQKKIISIENNKARLSANLDILENPRSVQSILLDRVHALPEELQEIVKWASILGNEFTVDHLASLCSSAADSTENIINSLVDDYNIFMKTDHRYSFNPYLLYQVVYSNMPEEEKCERHLEAAEVLQSKIHYDQKLCAAIANHLIKAKQTEDVAEYFFKAAKYAQKVNLLPQSEEWCKAGMDSLEHNNSNDEQLRGKFFLLMGSLARQKGDPDGYRENTYSAYNCAVISRDKNLEGIAFKALGEYYRSIADYKASIDYFQNALDVLREVNNDREVALILKEQSINQCFMGEFDKAIEVLTKSREICEELNDREGMARIYNNMGLIYKILGDIPLAKEWLERSMRLFREINDVQGEVLPIGNMAIIYTESGEFERAMILLKDITSTDSRLSDTRIQAKVQVTMGDVLLELGEYK